MTSGSRPSARLSAHVSPASCAPPVLSLPERPRSWALTRSLAASAIVPGLEVLPALGEGRRAAVRQNKKGGGEALAVARRFPGPFSRFWAERRRSERRENPGVHDERKRQGASAASAGCADATRPLAGARGGEEVLRGLVEA